jgi:hypothetical protein
MGAMIWVRDEESGLSGWRDATDLGTEEGWNGGGGSSPSLVDLGLIETADLLSGPITLHTPTTSDVILATYTTDVGFVPLDTDAHLFVVPGSGIAADAISGEFLLWTNAVDGGSYDASGNIALRTLNGKHPFQDGSAIKAVCATGFNGYPIMAALVDWQSAHAYAAFALILRSGTIWSADSGGGTSGGSAPDFASAPSEGDTVDDNTVTWTNEGEIPSAGALHVYLLSLAT